MPKRKRQTGLSLKGRLALVTGASRGIGFAIAEALAHEGSDLVITGRDERALEKARAALKKLKLHVYAQPCDVRSPESVDSLFSLIRSLRRPLDFLINNAGVAQPNLAVSDLPYPTWMEVIDTNLNGLFLVTQAALAVMKRGGAIVNNLSVAAERIFPGSSAYNASKHGALGFTETLREELRPKGIRVIALLPGATDTAIWDTLWPQAPRKKMMSSETVAQVVVAALQTPDEATVEKIVIRPSIGTL